MITISKDINNFLFYHRRFLCGLLIFTVIAINPLSAFYFQKSSNENLESQVKAAYIYNFTKFVYWNPAESNIKSDPVIIYVLGTDPVGNLLDDFSKKQAEGQSIIVKKIKKEFTDIANCNLLFISQIEKVRLPAILKQLDGTNVLTVSDIPGFTRQGGMIGFFIQNDKVKIEINLKAVNKAGLKISAKLLEVAKIVSDEV